MACGDMARNDVNYRENKPQPLGFDPISQYTFANSDLLMNMVAYLVDDDGLIRVRNKEVKIRPLDKEKIKNEKLFWQVVNLVLPIVSLIAFGVSWSYWRKRKYAKF